MDITQLLDIASPVAAALLVTGPAVYLLERTHRRTSRAAGGRLGRPLGADDPDVRRTRDELRFRAADERRPAPTRGTETAPVPKLRGRRHVWVSAPR
ncbi:hypothetical protein [Nostocoides sp. Soil756]|jgi:hypothetical protein|uniref:hypothetical protein n=1 Tax=Nostocoides sp. Soil756 TaxID=1736399 RepID=UPI0006F91004|nr:hypothetical protein [Tetrasphaera sp. Soil756]KRE61021.1 hypothetical protein ASG78_11735 [Tetrasphaera sp. Soil756]